MKVEIYGTENCPNCSTAEELTKKANFEYVMLKAGVDFEIPELFKKVGQRVAEFPQIFVDDKYIGNITAYRVFLKENIKEEETDLGDFEL